MDRCPDNILASAQAAATGGLYGYSETSTKAFCPYMGNEEDDIKGRNGIYILGPDQSFEFLNAATMYNEPRESRPAPEKTAAGTIVYVLHYGAGGYQEGEWGPDGKGFWRVTGLTTDDGRNFDLSET